MRSFTSILKFPTTAFTEARNRRAPRPSPASDDLHEAVEKNEFELHVQPQWSAMGNRVRSAEVFLRWRAEDGRLLTPVEFMDCLERSAVSLGVSEWVLREAARYLLGWHEIGLDTKVRVCVNVSRQELESAGFIDRAVGMFCEEGLGPESLTLDVREDLLASIDDRSRTALSRFRAQGGWVTIDDFGSGRCPLSALAGAPADAVKIDAAVVTRSSPRTEGGLAEGLVDLCRRLGLTVIAHKVESEEQRQALISAGFDRLQGNYFAEPALFRADKLPWWGAQEAAAAS